jgi:hypothetical protein
MVTKVVELKMEHILMFVIVAFVLYHFMGRCSCGMRRRDGFSVGCQNATCISKINVASNSSIKKNNYAPLCKNLRNTENCTNYYQIHEDDKKVCIKDTHENIFDLGIAPCKASNITCDSCPELHPLETPDVQMKKCYSSNNPKCKFEFGGITGFNKCIIDNDPLMWGCWEPSHQGHTWNITNPVGGWKGIDSSHQSEICELYGNSRNLKCQFVNSDSTNSESIDNKCEYDSTDVKNKWSSCTGECIDNDFPNRIAFDDWGDGDGCYIGAKALCSPRKSNNIWCGTAPFCEGVCPDGCKIVSKSDHGDGDKCYTGTKVLCDCKNNLEATCPK